MLLGLILQTIYIYRGMVPYAHVESCIIPIEWTSNRELGFVIIEAHQIPDSLKVPFRNHWCISQ